MKTTSALVRLVIFTVVTAIATTILAATIGSLGSGGSRTYHAIFSDVTGLNTGDDVRIAGVRVGEVKSIKIKGTNTADVTFSVGTQPELTQATRAVIRYRNLVGQRYVALEEGTGAPTPLPVGATIPLARTAPALDLTVLFNGFKPLFAALSPSDVNSLASDIISTLQGEGGSVQSLLAHTASLTSAIADRDAVIGRTIDNLNQVLGEVGQRDQKLTDLIDQMNRYTTGLAGDRQAIFGALGSIDSMTSETAGLLQQGRPALQSDIGNLSALAKNLDDNKQTLNSFLQTLPVKLNRLTRTASFGSWFDFYLCDFNAASPHSVPSATPGRPGLQLPMPSWSTNASRCNA